MKIITPQRRTKLEQFFTNLWYSQSNPLLLKGIRLFLIPFSFLFLAAVKFRRYLYKRHILSSKAFNVPIIIVGNITVGGVGKTPLVRAIVQLLQEQGYYPAVISRGVGGKKVGRVPHAILSGDLAIDYGDESVLLANQLQCLVVVCHSKVEAVKWILEHDSSVNIIVSDDGLQHYALKRAIEIAVIGTKQGDALSQITDNQSELEFGNGWCLPAGPLREPLSRLQEVDFILINNSSNRLKSKERWPHSYPFQTKLSEKLVSLLPSKTENLQPITSFKHKRVYAIAGIGRPQRFFNALDEQGIDLIPCSFPDHHIYQNSDFSKMLEPYPILMTEKDAVKCRTLSILKDKECWVVPLELTMDLDFQMKMLNKVNLKNKKD